MNYNETSPAVWRQLLERIMMSGQEVPAARRGNMNSDSTREVLACQSTIDMHYPVMTNKARKLNLRFMAAEALWILEGRNDVASIAAYNKRMAQFSDDGQTFFGAYGPRIRMQFVDLLKKLVEDPESRQAVMTIWRHNPPKSKDIPCTISVQFLVRAGRLHCLDNMRSSDLWLGWPYDVFNFSMLALFVLLHLREQGVNLKLGKLILTAGSQHVYRRDFEGVARCLEEQDEEGPQPFFSPAEFPTPAALLQYLKACADGEKSLTNPAKS